MTSDPGTPDFIVIGAGSAGCAVAAGLAARELSVLLVEAGPSDRHPLVRTPFGLVRLMGHATRDWRFQSTPQRALGGRRIAIPRGRMVGGSGSMNSMVWFRGRADDFDGWGVKGWGWDDVRPAFEAVEARTTPAPLADPHPLTCGLAAIFDGAAPTPERESAGVFSFNLVGGRRRSAADAFLRPTPKGVTLMTGRTVDRIGFERDVARRVHFTDGGEARARRGVVLSAGAIGSPAAIMNAVTDAVGDNNLSMPATPEKVWRALNG